MLYSGAKGTMTPNKALCCNMTRRKRLRRVAIVCCHCLRNLAFYRSGWNNGAFVSKDQFWINANGNFLDACVLEWCKLFADARGQHFWRKVVTEHQQFWDDLLKNVGLTQDEFDVYVKEMKTYRDKFIAHLDDDEQMQFPKLDLAQQTVVYLYDYILANEDEGGFFPDAPQDAAGHYSKYLEIGKAAYAKAT